MNCWYAELKCTQTDSAHDEQISRMLGEPVRDAGFHTVLLCVPSWHECPYPLENEYVRHSIFRLSNLGISVIMCRRLFITHPGLSVRHFDDGMLLSPAYYSAAIVDVKQLTHRARNLVGPSAGMSGLRVDAASERLSRIVLQDDFGARISHSAAEAVTCVGKVDLAVPAKLGTARLGEILAHRYVNCAGPLAGKTKELPPSDMDYDVVGLLSEAMEYYTWDGAHKMAMHGHGQSAQQFLQQMKVLRDAESQPKM